MFRETNDPGRRLVPRIIDTDWLVMRDLSRSVRRAATDHLHRGEKLLDFGAGTQPYAPIFHEIGCEYFPADLDSPGEIRVGEDGKLTAPDNSVDAVCSFQVLEHVPEAGAYLAEARRVLKADGRLLLSTHGVWLYHPQPEDHRRWTRFGLLREIERSGFEIVNCEAIVGPMAWTTVLRLTGYGYVLRRFGLAGKFVSAVLCLIMNVRAWVEDRLTPAWVTEDNACIYMVVARRR